MTKPNLTQIDKRYSCGQKHLCYLSLCYLMC